MNFPRYVPEVVRDWYSKISNDFEKLSIDLKVYESEHKIPKTDIDIVTVKSRESFEWCRKLVFDERMKDAFVNLESELQKDEDWVVFFDSARFATNYTEDQWRKKARAKEIVNKVAKSADAMLKALKDSEELSSNINLPVELKDIRTLLKSFEYQEQHFNKYNWDQGKKYIFGELDYNKLEESPDSNYASDEAIYGDEVGLHKASISIINAWNYSPSLSLLIARIKEIADNYEPKLTDDIAQKSYDSRQKNTKNAFCRSLCFRLKEENITLGLGLYKAIAVVYNVYSDNSKDNIDYISVKKAVKDIEN